MTEHNEREELADEVAQTVGKVLEKHSPGNDWHCTCGEDFFGGTAAYSWLSFTAHRDGLVAAAVLDSPWLADEIAYAHHEGFGRGVEWADAEGNA